MNYQRLYNSIIENRQNNVPAGYTENHHIIPRSLGGTDEQENIVTLTAREHFLCHYLLTRIYATGSEHHKMLTAFLRMKCSSLQQDRYYNARLYEKLKIKFSKVCSKKMKGIGNPAFGTKWITDGTQDKKILKTDPIPTGWLAGRIVKKPKIKTCKNCGQTVCAKPDVCNRHQLKNTFIKFLGFDATAVGSENYYKEFDRIVNMLREEYESGLSIEDINIKYKFNSNERVRTMFRALGIKRRDLSDALKNYNK